MSNQGPRGRGMQLPERLDRKRVRRAELVSAEGTSDVALLVPCKPLGRDVAIEVCSACAKCKSLPEDPTLDGAEVVCRLEPTLSPAPRLKDVDMVEAALRTPVGEVVSTDALALALDVTVDAATEIAKTRGLSAMTVVDPAKKPVAVVTWMELVAAAREGRGASKVGDLGRPLVSAYAMDGPLLHALPAVADGTVGFAIVVSKDGTFYGLLSAPDVARWLARRAGYEL